MRIRPWLAALTTFSVLGAIGVGFGVAQASIHDSPGIIHACYRLHGGQLRVIGSGQSCRRDERRLSWPSTVSAGVTGWQLIQCTVSVDQTGDITVSGNSLCSASGQTVTILCPQGKVAMQEAGSLFGYTALGQNTYPTVLPDGSGADFYFGGAASISDASIQLVCADGST
jgi:hypothetical protein